MKTSLWYLCDISTLKHWNNVCPSIFIIHSLRYWQIKLAFDVQNENVVLTVLTWWPWPRTDHWSCLHPSMSIECAISVRSTPNLRHKSSEFEFSRLFEQFALLCDTSNKFFVLFDYCCHCRTLPTPGYRILSFSTQAWVTYTFSYSRRSKLTFFLYFQAIDITSALFFNS